MRDFIIVVGVLVAVAAWFAYNIPGGNDVDVANALGNSVAIGYGRFDARAKVETTYRGKIYYVSPGARGNPTLILYEVTAPAEMAAIEQLAKKALGEIAGANSVTIKFYEAQNMKVVQGGGASRGSEVLVRKRTFDKNG